MKKNLLYLLVAFFTLSVISCKDDDNTFPIEQKIAGTYKGALDITMYANGNSEGTEIAKNFPQKVYLSKVDDNGIKMELKNFSVIGLDLGDISVDRSEIIENGGSYSFFGEQTLDLTAKGLGKCPIKVDGIVTDGKTVLNIDVTVTELSQIVKVKFTGNRLTGAESSEAKITAFTFSKDIAANSVIIMQPQINGTDILFMVSDTAESNDLKALVPTITLSSKATVSPVSGIAQDFSIPVKYTVTAEDGTQQVYTVSTTKVMSLYDFEDWTIYDVGDPEQEFLNFYEPNGWATSNAALMFLKAMELCPKDASAVGKLDNGFKGKAAKLTSNDSQGAYMITVVPKVTAASLFLGEFVINMENTLKSTHFGVPFYKKPLSVKGYYKYKAGTTYYETKVSGSGLETQVEGVEVPGMKDSCAMTAVLYEVQDYATEWLDGVTLFDPATTNIVAIGELKDGSEKTAFTPFELELNYLKTYDPAKKYKFSIIFSSSKNGAIFAGAPGSELIIDEVEIVNE